METDENGDFVAKNDHAIGHDANTRLLFDTTEIKKQMTLQQTL